MTTSEVLELFESKSGKFITYEELREAMKKLGIKLKGRMYRGFLLWSYLSRGDIHLLADYFGINLYPDVRYSDGCPIEGREKWVTLHN